jgi:hypothetical protein
VHFGSAVLSLSPALCRWLACALIARTRDFIDIHGVSIHSRTLLNNSLEAPGCDEILILLPLCSACELSDATASGQGRLDTAQDAA